MFVGALWIFIWFLMLFCYLFNVNSSKNIPILPTEAWCGHTVGGKSTDFGMPGGIWPSGLRKNEHHIVF